MIKEIKKLTKMSKVAMAELLGVNRMSIRNYNQGRMPPYIKKYLALSKYVIENEGLDKFKEVTNVES